jgi:hypothetical protein
MSEQDFLTEIMGLNPSDLNVFNETEQSNSNSIIYKTNPALSKSEDGHYRASIRVVYDPRNPRESIVKSLRYNCKDENGFFYVNSALVNGDKNCPMFKAWKQLWFAKTPDGKPDEAKREWSKAMFDRTESQWVIVQIINDNNQPELNGTFKIMKLPKAIYNRLTAKMNPSPESGKQPVKLMDYIFGLELEMDVIPGPADAPYRVSYDSCDFQNVMPIINTDGTQLFTDEELELIDEYATHQANFLKAKTENTKQKELAAMQKLADPIRECYAKAIKVVKENAPDLTKECGYRPWTEEETARINRWIDNVVNLRNPEVATVTEGGASQAFEAIVTPQASKPASELIDPVLGDITADFITNDFVTESTSNDLPF